MKVTLKHVENMQFKASTESGHDITLDASPDHGGENAGARPMETVLVGLGGCSAIDVMLILKKSRQQVTDCEIEIQAERADAIPAVFSKIHVSFILTGDNLDSKKVNRAVALSMEKYCSVTRMLEKTADMTFDARIQQG